MFWVRQQALCLSRKVKGKMIIMSVFMSGINKLLENKLLEKV
jgi:hypothetical protein